MPFALVAFGSNVGNSRKRYREVQTILSNETDHVELIRASQAIETQPIVGDIVGELEQTEPIQGESANFSFDQGVFLNAALLIRTTLTAQEMLEKLQRIENQLGRVRDRRWGPRAVDLDLLLFDDLIIEQGDLICPHPRMSFRRFVLEPSAEIATEMLHPGTGRTVGELLGRLNDRSRLVVWLGGSSMKELRLVTESQTPLKQTLSLIQSEQWPVVEQEAKPNCFWICPVTDAKQFQALQSHAMLLIKPINVDLNHSLAQCGADFRGASLAVDPSRSDWKIEIHAAIDAMI